MGHTGKGWAPGDWKVSGRLRNPAGPEFGRRTLPPLFEGMRDNDYAGKKLEDVVVSPFLPDTPEVRGDILDYCVEIEWFDTHLARMLQALEDAGELDSTLVIVSADNGMSFPRAKANCYEFGIHTPLAIRWGARVPGGRSVDDVVGFVDVTATILDACGVRPPTAHPIAGRSLLDILLSTKQGLVDPTRTAAWSARDRHCSSGRLTRATVPFAGSPCRRHHHEGASPPRRQSAENATRPRSSNP